MIDEYKRLEKEKLQIEKELKNLPEGKLIISKNKSEYVSWFVSYSGEKRYIPKEEIELAQKLAYRKILTLQLNELEDEMRAINFYLRHHKEGIPKSLQTIIDSPELQKLLYTQYVPLEQELDNWMHESYRKNEAHSEHLIHKTCTGEFVRSKSEAFIYTSLCKNKIPFRYEAELDLGSFICYPDFTIRHPKTGKVIYWEHFGLMNSRKYASNTFSKLDVYHSYGIIPGKNLIMTFETKENPLNLESVRKIIEEYFL